MCERSGILFSLLEDGLTRAAQEPKISEIILSRMNLQREDSIHFLQQSRKIFHTVYLDPMYPHRPKAALNKQEMRVIRELVGKDEDSDGLLKQALAAAKNRVVVKRPKGAQTLSSDSPSYVVSMKNSRYDIYL
jgi:16S rRNA (guanine1516-N2)-methyltransferase